MPRFAIPVVLSLAVLSLPACRGGERADVAREPGRTAPVSLPAAPVSTAARPEAETPAAMRPTENTATPAPARESPAASQPTPLAPRQETRPAEERATASATSATAQDAEEILERVERAYSDVRAMEADFVQQLSIPLLGTNQTSSGKIYQRKPDRFLMKFTDPAGDVIVADGQSFWMYYPSTDRTQVIRASMSEGGRQADLQQEFLSNASERYVATLVGEEAVDGRPAHVLTLVPKGESPYKLVKVWVDKGDFLVRRFEMREENDSVRRLELSDLRLNGDLPDSLFRFTPPPGTQVFNQ